LLRPWARSTAQRVAVVTEDRQWTFAALDERADELAAGFLGLGIRPSDRVVVHLPNGADFIAVSIGLFRLGAIPVFALPSLRRAEISYLCEHAEAVAYVIPPSYHGFDYLPLARAVKRSVATLKHVLVAGNAMEFYSLDSLLARPEPIPSPDPSDVAFFLLSGGTTGRPKLIPRTHDDYAFQLRETARAMGFDERGVYLAALPIAHNAALGCPGVLGALRAGGKAVLAASPSPDDVFPLVRRERPTLTTLMPSLLTLWLQTAQFFNVDLSGLVIEVGGAMLPPEVARQVRPTLGCHLTQWFGMAEGLLCFTRLDDSDEVAATTQGRPLCPADEIRIVDDLDGDVDRGSIGQLLVRGPTTFRGYYRAPELNATTFTPDGFFRTGDLVRMTDDGRLVAVGRIKDVINRGGEKVPVEEVEDHLRTHPGVRNVAVVAMPDPMMGEKSCAFVVPGENPPTLSELRRFLVECGLADYKLPDRLELVDSLPMTSIGKLDRRALRAGVASKLAETLRP
jgi:2,3-dihydroxybenzoate-AMP ligase